MKTLRHNIQQISNEASNNYAFQSNIKQKYQYLEENIIFSTNTYKDKRNDELKLIV